MIQEKIRIILAEVTQEKPESIKLEHPEISEHGDYSSNVALVLGKKQGKNPREVAEGIVAKIKLPKEIEKVEIAGPGFINFFLSKEYFLEVLSSILKEKEKYGSGKNKKKVIVEFTDPNPFKQFHIGHLYDNAVGESLSRIFSATGATVKRANYQGDVGLHVAKAIYGMQKFSGQMPKDEASLSDRVRFLGECYAFGNSVYEPIDKDLAFGSPANNIDSWKNKEENEDVKRINEINAAVYKKNNKEINFLYSKGRKWSLDYFETIYKRLGTKFDYYYFESEVGKMGLDLVKNGLEKGIFERSQGAVIFPGEKYGLHSRVFINSLGLPTYETKELGLAPTKYKAFKYDLSIIVTGNEIIGYFNVLLCALSKLYPELADKTKHISHGMVRLPEGKMSSRTGNVIRGEDLLDEVKSRVLKIMNVGENEVPEKERDAIAEMIAIGAIKYSFLRVSVGKDISFDFEKSLSIEGESGPYLQYTYARCHSILRKSGKLNLTKLSYPQLNLVKLSTEEMNVLRMLYKFPEVVREAAERFSPNLVATFAFETAQAYNLFYNTHSVLQAETTEAKDFRLFLTAGVAQIIQNSLSLLGIKTPERM